MNQQRDAKTWCLGKAREGRLDERVTRASKELLKKDQNQLDQSTSSSSVSSPLLDQKHDRSLLPRRCFLPLRVNQNSTQDHPPKYRKGNKAGTRSAGKKRKKKKPASFKPKPKKKNETTRVAYTLSRELPPLSLSLSLSRSQKMKA